MIDMNSQQRSELAGGHPPAAGGVGVRNTVALFRRCVWIERQCLPALAAWFLLSPRYETKIVIGYLLWSHAERATELRNRLAELRGGHHDANVEPALARLTTALARAPDADSFLAGWLDLARALLAAYEDYVAAADPSANAQDIRVLRRLIVDLRDATERTATIVDAFDEAAIGPWRADLAAKLNAAGGITGESPREIAPASAIVSAVTSAPAQQQPLSYQFDSRIREGEFDDYANRMSLPYEEKRIAELQVYFNEFYAAGLLATVLIDAWTSAAPWEFFRDISHHFWDEVRHAEFGMVRLRELGVEPNQVNLVLFNASRAMPFLHRLCYLTLGLEVYFMPRKRPRVERYAAAGDSRTQLFADVDWSDEGNHVQYGKRWVEYFLADDARSVQNLQDEIAEQLKSAGLLLKDGQLAPY
jgi:hypothetical protein